MEYEGGFLTPNLASLALGSLTLSPTFDKDTVTYSTNSTNATNTLSYTTESASATVATKLNDVTFTGSTVTWSSNTDTLKVIVTDGTLSKTYTITCTHTT